MKTKPTKKQINAVRKKRQKEIHDKKIVNKLPTFPHTSKGKLLNEKQADTLIDIVRESITAKSEYSVGMPYKHWT